MTTANPYSSAAGAIMSTLTLPFASETPSDPMSIATCHNGYEEEIKAALAVEPSMINGIDVQNIRKWQMMILKRYFSRYVYFPDGRKTWQKTDRVENFQASEKNWWWRPTGRWCITRTKEKSYDYEGSMTNSQKWRCVSQRATSTFWIHWKPKRFFLTPFRRNFFINAMNTS